MNAVSIRGDWAGKVIDGRFPLLEWLGGSGSSGSFVTELDGRGSQKATLKLFSDPAQAEGRLSTWKAMADLSHVHLVRVLQFGRAEVDGVPLVYVVTEFAEEVLSQIIPERPLTGDEAREMLGPILDALSYVHSKGFVHAHLRPSNILVVENEVKLSADGLLIADASAAGAESSDVHNAPELATGSVTPAADIWSLGVTVVEALTQQVPLWDGASHEDPPVPNSLPRPFGEIARACLRVDRSTRCGLDDVRAMLQGKPKLVRAEVKPATDLQAAGLVAEPAPKTRMPIVPLVAGLILLLIIGIGFAIRSHRTNTAPLETETTQQAPAAEPDSKTAQPAAAPAATGAAATASENAATGGSAKAEVLKRDVPDVPQSASNTIQGKVTVAVRVNVNEEGAVTNAEFATHGPSAYFARLAMESARKWTFKPAQSNGHAAPSVWLLRYQFKRSGPDVSAEQAKP